MLGTLKGHRLGEGTGGLQCLCGEGLSQTCPLHGGGACQYSEEQCSRQWGAQMARYLRQAVCKDQQGSHPAVGVGYQVEMPWIGVRWGRASQDKAERVLWVLTHCICQESSQYCCVTTIPTLGSPRVAQESVGQLSVACCLGWTWLSTSSGPGQGSRSQLAMGWHLMVLSGGLTLFLIALSSGGLQEQWVLLSSRSTQAGTQSWGTWCGQLAAGAAGVWACFLFVKVTPGHTKTGMRSRGTHEGPHSGHS